MATFDRACVVNLFWRGSRSEQHGTSCGILLNTQTGLVLAHASCLAPYAEKGDLDLLNMTLSDLHRLDCEVLLQEDRLEGSNSDKEGPVSSSRRVVTKVGANHLDNSGHALVNESGPNFGVEDHNAHKVRGLGEAGNLEKLRQRRSKFYAYSKFSAKAVNIFHCEAVVEALDELMPSSSWELLDRTETHKDLKVTGDSHNNRRKRVEKSEEELAEVNRKLLGSFVVLSLNNWSSYASRMDVRSTMQCRRGDAVEIVSTPFAGLKPDAFLNSLSRGVVSNLGGKDNCLLLSDARCILGGEGAPLYTFDRLGASQPTR